MASCSICHEAVDNPIILTEKGANGVNFASAQRKRDDVIAYAGSAVHMECRKRYTDKKNFPSPKRKSSDSCTDDNVNRRRPRLEREERHKICLFCSTPVTFEVPRYTGEAPEGIKVEYHEFTEAIKACCKDRGDEWAWNVKGKIEFYCGDLPANDVVYHRSCSSNFRTKKNIPCKYSTIAERGKPGRPENATLRDAFLDTCADFESRDDEQLSISDLVNLMEEKLSLTECPPYDQRYMKKKLIEHYGDDITLSEDSGKKTIITYRPKVSSILREYYGKPKDLDIELEKLQLIEAAASLVKSEIQEKVTTRKDIYPPPEELSRENSLRYVPSLLRLLLSKMFSGPGSEATDLKVAAIGQCIVQAVRPRAVMAPLQIGLAVQLHEQFGSQYLLDTLHNMGYCSSYKEELRFKRNAAVVSGSQLDGYIGEDSFMKFSGDNVDHNLCTLDGKGTFHGMGMIAAITNGTFSDKLIPRNVVSDEDLITEGAVKFVNYQEQKQNLKKISFQNLRPLMLSTTSNVDLLWKLCWYFKNPLPNWNGCMQLIYNDKQSKYQKDQIVFLPIVDADPTDMSCILSTLTFLSSLAKKHNNPAIITFDQPLFWKASKIVNESNDSIIQAITVLLGTFHTVMNLLGCIGDLMEGSGISDILCEIYGNNAVTHMLTGKAYSRALRGHLIIDQVLTTLLVDLTNDNSFVKELSDLFDGVLDGTVNIMEVENNLTLQNMHKEIEETKRTLAQGSRTSKLWLEYQHVVDIIRKFIKADRLGLWNLHLEAFQESLPIFAAAGHFNYVKSSYLYLQKCIDLQTEKTIVYEHFQSGGFVVRRSARCWAGIACDLAIEQVLMRSLKSTGGLTRGTGMSEVQRSIWLLSKPLCSTYSLKMEENVGVLHTTSEQHKGIGKTRMIRDKEDTAKVFNRLSGITPFNIENKSLINITNGVAADESSNVDNFVSIGASVVQKMIGKNVYDYKFKKKDAAKTMSIKARIGKNNEIEIDPALLFQRLLIVAKASTISIKDIYSYELCSYPPAIFESPILLRKADKPKIIGVINNHAEVNSLCTDVESVEESVIPTCSLEDHQYVLDGGSLLYRINWKKDMSYLEIADSYVNFVKSNYGEALIVFDGYLSGPSTKDNTHLRRSTKVSKLINFTPDMKLHCDKASFMANVYNKTKIIQLIGSQLQKANCKVIYDEEDADVNVALSACKEVLMKNVTVIGEDSDILVLLLYHSTKCSSRFKLIYRSDLSQTKFKEGHDIFLYLETLGVKMCTHFLFIHAFSGCDTTSSFSGIGKPTFFKSFIKSEPFQKLSDVFTSDDEITQDIIEEAGLRATLLLYNAKKGEDMADLRHRVLSEKILSSTTFVGPEKLPPTEASVKYHSYRTYYQILKWKGKQINTTPDHWGWYESSGKYYPRIMDTKYAPDALLKIIHCGCETNCSSLRCSCKKNGMRCTYVCGSCQEEGSCCNVDIIQYIPDENFLED